MHDTVIAPGRHRPRLSTSRNLTRVEGEGSLHLRVRDGAVESAHLEIFEAPRYFERLVVGRSMDEVIDIVARICGICPVAYQMTAVHAAEAAFGIDGRSGDRRAASAALLRGVDREPRPAYLPAASAGPARLPERARPGATRSGRPWRAGFGSSAPATRIVAQDRRARHPSGVRSGRRVLARHPPRRDRARCAPTSMEALDLADATIDLVAGLEPPAFRREARLVALRDADEYPMNHGRIVSNDGLDIPATPGRRCSRSGRSRGRTRSRPRGATASRTCSVRRRG